MIHTFTIRHQINAEEYKKFIAAARTQIYNTDGYHLKNSMLEEMGLVLYAKKYRVKDRPDYFCYDLFVNPCKVLGRINPTELYTPDMFDAFQEQFNHIIQSYNLDLPELNHWKAYRVDYARNLLVDDVDLYIRMFQKSDLAGYKFPKDDNNNRVRFRSGSLYCKKGNHTINFYNKYDEMEKEKVKYTPEEMEMAKNVLRIEVQCRRTKLDGLKKTYDLPDKNIVHFLKNADISRETLKYYVKKIMGTSPFYKRPTAERLIQRSDCQNRTKEQMLQIIRGVSAQYSAVDKVIGDNQDLKIAKKAFERIGVNPVTVNKNEENVSVCLAAIYDQL